jgi:hypothetical protein
MVILASCRAFFCQLNVTVDLTGSTSDRHNESSNNTRRRPQRFVQVPRYRHNLVWYPLPINHTRLTQWVSFHQGYPESLVRLQNEHWDPLLNWARDTFDIELLTSDSLSLNVQPEATKRKLDDVLQGFDPWKMAGCVSFIHPSCCTQICNGDSDGARDFYDQIVHHCTRTRTRSHHRRAGCAGISGRGCKPDRALGRS